MTVILSRVTFENADPAWLWPAMGIAAVVMLVMTYRDIHQRSGSGVVWWLLGMRLAALALVLTALVKPAWTWQSETVQQPTLAVVVDDSLSMTQPHGQDEDGRVMSRYELVQRRLREHPALSALPQQFDVAWFDILGRPVGGGPPGEPTAEQTDLVRAVRSAADRLRGRHVVGAVLISDGRDTVGRGDFLELRDLPVNVSTIGFGRRSPAGTELVDLAITDVQAPERVLVHNAAPVEVRLEKDGGPAVAATVTLERAGEVLNSQLVPLEAGPVRRRVTINHTPDQAGDFVFTARVGSDEIDEPTYRNNTRLFNLRVDAEPIRVLYIEGVLRAEFTFLRDRLAEDPDIHVITFVRTADADEAVLTGRAIGAEVVTAERLEEMDVVLLGDFEAQMLPDETYELLREWVEGGGSLMVLGGYHNLGRDGLGATPLALALPVETADGAVEQIDDAFDFTLTDEGRRHPALSLSGDRQRDAESWSQLPSLAGIVATRRERSGAVVLARHPRPNPDDPDGRGYIVLAEQGFGQGRSVVLTADTTWRWSRIPRIMGRPDTLYLRFWSQMVRYLAGRDEEGPRTVLTVSTDRPAYDRGQSVRISLRRNPAAVLGEVDLEQARPRLSVRSPEGQTTDLPLTVSDLEPGLWETAYAPARGGRYRIDAALDLGEGPDRRELVNEVGEFIVIGTDLELEDPTPDPAAMRQIAAIAGGMYADITDDEAITELAGEWEGQTRVIEHTRSVRLWDDLPLAVILALFIALVCTEWTLRRRRQWV